MFDNLNLDIWYYGNKKLTTITNTDNIIKLSNNDVIKYNNGLYFNNELISNIPDLTEQEIYDMYISYLKRKGYKILNGK